MACFTSFHHVAIISAQWQMMRVQSLVKVEKEAASSKFMEKTAKRDSHALFSPFLSVSRNGHEVAVVSVIVEILHFQWEREAPGSVFTTDSESAEIPAIFSRRKSKNGDLRLCNWGNMWRQLVNPPSYNSPIFCVKPCGEIICHFC